MIILDTNVLSELMRPAPATKVVAWVTAQPAPSLFTTSITQAEILLGLMLFRRADAVARSKRRPWSMFAEDFGGRILGFGADAARPTLDRLRSPTRGPADLALRRPDRGHRAGRTARNRHPQRGRLRGLRRHARRPLADVTAPARHRGAGRGSLAGSVPAFRGQLRGLADSPASLRA